MENNDIESRIQELLQTEDKATLEGLSKLSKSEIEVLAYKNEVKKETAYLEDALYRERNRSLHAFGLILLVGALGGIASAFAPFSFLSIDSIIKEMQSRPLLARFLLGFFFFGLTGRLVIAFHVYRKMVMYFSLSEEKIKATDSDMGLVLTYFTPSKIEALDSLLLSASDITEYIYKKTGQRLNEKALGRKLKRHFPRTKSRKYIVKKIS